MTKQTKIITTVVLGIFLLILLFLVFGQNNPAMLDTILGTDNTFEQGSETSGTTTGGGGNPAQTLSGTIFTAKLNEKISFSGGTGVITEVLEDSRCPTDVQCIQAGTVRIKVNFTYGTLSQNINLTLNEPYTYSGSSITLVKVSPENISTVSISSSNYVFSLLVK